MKVMTVEIRNEKYVRVADVVAHLRELEVDALRENDDTLADIWHAFLISFQKLDN